MITLRVILNIISKLVIYVSDVTVRTFTLVA